MKNGVVEEDMEATKTIANRKKTHEKQTHNNANENRYNEINVLICKPNLLFFSLSLCLAHEHENEYVSNTSCFYKKNYTEKKPIATIQKKKIMCVYKCNFNSNYYYYYKTSIKTKATWTK